MKRDIYDDVGFSLSGKAITMLIAALAAIACFVVASSANNASLIECLFLSLAAVVVIFIIAAVLTIFTISNTLKEIRSAIDNKTES